MLGETDFEGKKMSSFSAKLSLNANQTLTGKVRTGSCQSKSWRGERQSERCIFGKQSILAE